MTLEKVIGVLADHLEMDASEIKEETTFEDLGIDSLDVVEIMMEMEDEFDIEIKPTDLVPENFNSAEAILALVETLQDE